MTTLKTIHYWAGVAGLIVFLLSGQYMHIYQNHLQGLADGPRMVFRASHIYLLLAAFINLAMGAGLSGAQGKFKQILQYMVSIIVLVAPLGLLAGFFTEPQLDELQRPYTRLALFALFGAAILLCLAGFRNRKKPAR
jgi:Na+-driven multidrug efflux pump